MPQNFYPQYYSNTGNYTSNNSTLTGTHWIWQDWTAPVNSTIYVQSNAISPNEVWRQWQTPPYTYATSALHTPEAVREANERWEAQRREEREKRQAARVRARLLLGEFLDDEQKAELEHHGRFFVTGSRGRRYCIRAEGQSGNVDLLKPDGSVQARLCCHPRWVPGENDMLPEGDAWLVQMIEIRHDEDHFLRTANVHRGVLPALV